MSLFRGKNGPLTFVLLSVDEKEYKELEKVITENGGVLGSEDSTIPIRFIQSFKISADSIPEFKCYDVRFIHQCVTDKQIVDPAPYRFGKKLLFDECLMSHFLLGGCNCLSPAKLENNIRSPTARDAFSCTSPDTVRAMPPIEQSSRLSDSYVTPIGSIPEMPSDLPGLMKNSPPITLSPSTATPSQSPLSISSDSMSSSKHDRRSCSDSPNYTGDSQNNSPNVAANRQIARNGNEPELMSEDNESDDNQPIDESQSVVSRPHIMRRPTQLSSGDGKSTEVSNNDEKRPCSLEYKMQVEPKMRALENEVQRRENERRKVTNSLGLGSKKPQQRTATTLSNACGTADVSLPVITMDTVENIPELQNIPEESLTSESTVEYIINEEPIEAPSPSLSSASTVIVNGNSRRGTRRKTKKRPRRITDNVPIEHAPEPGWIQGSESQEQHYINTAASVRENFMPLRSKTSPLPEKRKHVIWDEPSTPRSKKRCESPREQTRSLSLKKLSASSRKEPSASSPKKLSASSPKKLSASSPKKPSPSAAQKLRSSTSTKAPLAEDIFNSTVAKNPMHFRKRKNERSAREQKTGPGKDLNTSEQSAALIDLNDSTDRSSDEILISPIPSILENANDDVSMTDDNEHAVGNSTIHDDDSHWNIPGTSSGVNCSRTIPRYDVHSDSMSENEFREKRKAAIAKKAAILARVDGNVQKSRIRKSVETRSKKSHKKVAKEKNSLMNWRNGNARVDRAHDISVESSDDDPLYSFIRGKHRPKKTTGNISNKKQNKREVDGSHQEKVIQKKITKRTIREKDSNDEDSNIKFVIPDNPLVRRFGLPETFLPRRPETAWTRVRAIYAARLKERDEKEWNEKKRKSESELSENTKSPTKKNPAIEIEIQNNDGEVWEEVSSNSDCSDNESRLNEDISPKKSKVSKPVPSDGDCDNNDSESNENRLSKKSKLKMVRNPYHKDKNQNKRGAIYEFDSSSEDDNDDDNNNTGSKFLKQFYNKEKPKLTVEKSKPTGMSEKNDEIAECTKKKIAETKSKHYQSPEKKYGNEEDLNVLSDDAHQELLVTSNRLSDKEKSNNEKSRMKKRTVKKRRVYSACSLSSSGNDDSDDEVLPVTNDQSDKSKRWSMVTNVTKSPNKSPNKPAMLFTDFENEQLVLYLVNTNSIAKTRGMLIFKDMSHDKNLRHRSAESLSTHFHNVILPDIDKFARQFKLSSITVEEFKELLDS